MRPHLSAPLTIVVLCVTVCGAALPRRAPRAPAEDGYDLWLRYRLIADTTRLSEYRRAITQLVVQSESPTISAARAELVTGLHGLLGRDIPTARDVTRDGALVLGTPASSRLIAALPLAAALREAGAEGFVIRSMTTAGRHGIVIAANGDVGVLYGAFHLLRMLQTNAPLAGLDVVSAPRYGLRLLDHWDNLDGTVERGYAGASLWEWARLPDSISPRYADYARANASIGINGVVLTNVNANAQILTPAHLAKVAALARVFRPYGIRVYLTARFSAPIEIGALATADPLDSTVRAWWGAKANEIYRAIPDFGGFLVKANSEGQPGPQEYQRTHADGANMLADAVAPHGGIVMWRAFVYSNTATTDRVMQAYDEFVPLDGAFRPNVLIQVKNGPLDFQPREPFHPLFGAMHRTPLMMEFQITKEYLGQDTHLVFLGPLWEEVLRTDTYAQGPGSTVDKEIQGIAGVANVGTDRDWCGSDFNQANWFAFGRLAWNPTLPSSGIAEEWVRMTFSNDARVVGATTRMMLASREATVNYMTPLGLAHQMARGHHYGPGPWVTGGRADQTSVYFNRADSTGLGFDRTPTGSDAVRQYFPPLPQRFASRDSVPEALLLWFHHVGWRERLRSGRTLWDELLAHYQAGVDTVLSMQRTWDGLKTLVDADRFRRVQDFLGIQEAEARWWRDASVLYWQSFSHLPLPPSYEQPAHELGWYRQLRCPADPRKPRCAAVF
ncbi:MAG TPA: alpha-glucuronidase family glycosyl hydrolase [Gemmatimonadales bacterium]|nr:alpha-glucuronidase family glycosyl hydrolase [Gemmatimonadales bacterium]